MPVTHRQKYTFLPVLLVLAAILAGCNPPTGDTRERIGKLASSKDHDGAATPDEPYQIVVIPRISNPDFQQAVLEGANRAAKEFNAKIIWHGPPSRIEASSAGNNEAEIARQIKLIAESVEQKVDGIVLAPADSTRLVIPVNKAAKARIPIAIFGADVNTKNKLSLVAADDLKAGQLAARHLGEMLGGRGTIALATASDSPYIRERERAFQETIAAEFPQIKVVQPDENSSEITALYCPDENTTLNALHAAQNQKQSGRMPMVGFGSSPALINALKSGEISALVVENPYRTGYESVKAVVDHIQLREPPRRIDSGVTIMTKESMNTPENQRLLR